MHKFDIHTFYRPAGDTGLATRRAQAASGDAEALMTLYYALASRPVSQRNREEEEAVLRDAADAHHPRALLLLGNRHLYGSKGYPCDPMRAHDLMLRAAKAGCPHACIRVKDVFANHADIPEEQAAEADDDLREIYRTTLRRAIAGDDDAKLRLVELIYWGAGRPADPSAAVRLGRRYAESINNATALHDHAMRLYYSESRTEADTDECIRYFSRAHVAGSPDAAGYLAVLFTEHDCLRRNEREACLWMEIHAHDGCPDCALELAHRLESGRGVARDLTHACVLLMAVIERASTKYTPKNAVTALRRIIAQHRPHPEISAKVVELLKNASEPAHP